MKHSANLKRTFTSVMLGLKEGGHKSLANIYSEAKSQFGHINVSSKTVEKWFDTNNGPRNGTDDWCSLLQVLSALTRDRAAVDEILRLSQLKTFDALSASNDLEIRVLGWWKKVFEGDQEEETLAENQILQQSMIPPITDIPDNSYFSAHPNPLFMGRDHDLLEIADYLSAGRGVILVGLGGIGKTQLAIEFAHRYGHRFGGGVFMVSCIDRATATSQIAACGGSQGMEIYDEQTELSIGQQVLEVQKEWRREVPRLLIFDNVDAESSLDLEHWLLNELIPPSGGSKIIVTSTKFEWSPLVPLRVKKLEGFQQFDAITYLQGLAGHISTSTASRISDALERHPLGIHVAASYLSKYHLSVDPEEYAAQLEADPTKDFGKRLDSALSPTGHIASIDRTFSFSYNKLISEEEVDRLSLQLLTFAAHLSPGEPIPVRMVSTYMKSEISSSASALEDVIDRLSDVGLANMKDGHLFVHRLVAMFVRKRTSWSDDVFEKFLPVIATASTKFVQGEYNTFLWQWLPHLLYLGQQAKAHSGKHSSDWLMELGGCLTALQYIQPARDFLLASLRWQETDGDNLDQEHLAMIHHKLGLNYSADHDYDGCYEHIVHAYNIRRILLEEQPENDRVEREYARTLNNLGFLLLRLGRLEEAEESLHFSLEIKNKLSLSKRATYNNLALLKLLQNNANPPESLTEALHLLNQSRDEGGNYETFLRLGVTYHLIGDYAQCDACFDEAIKLMQSRFPPFHHVAGDAFYRLGRIFITSQNQKAASICFEQAVSLLKKTNSEEGKRLLQESLHALGKICLGT